MKLTLRLGPRIFSKGYRSVALWRKELPLNRTKTKQRESSYKRLPEQLQPPSRREKKSDNKQNDDPLMKYGFNWLLSAVNKIPATARPITNYHSIYQMEAEMLKEYIERSNISQNPTQKDHNLWKGLRNFSKLKPSPEDSPPLDVLLELFEVAKAQSTQYQKNLRVKQVGDIIYSCGKNIRLDPINESAYIDAMFSMGNKYKAMRLWESRVGKRDVLDSSYWQEVGVLLYLRRYNWKMAENLAQEMENEFGYIPPKLILHFISVYCRLNSDDKIDEWYHKLLHSVQNRNRISKKLAKAKSVTASNDSPSVDNLISSLQEFLKHSQWSMALINIKDLQSLNIEIPVFPMLKTIDQATRALSKIGRKKPNSQRQYRPTTKHSSDFVPLLSALISINPELLHSSSLYQSWLRGLTAMGLTQNAMQVFEAMVQRKIIPSVDDMAVLTQSLLNGHQWDTAWEVLSRMKRKPSEDDQILPDPTIRIYNFFLRYAIRSGYTEYVDRVIENMEPLLPHYSENSINMLLTFYSSTKQYGKIFDLYTPYIEKEIDPSHAIWRQLWLTLRKVYQESSVLESIQAPDCRHLFSSMVSSQHYKPSLHVYEYAANTMILNNDTAGACAILCYMETSNSMSPTIILSTGLVDLALKIKHGSKALFAPAAGGSRNEALVGSSHPALSEPTIPWETVTESICTTLELDPAEIKAQAKKLAAEWEQL